MPYGVPPGLRSIVTDSVAGPASAGQNAFTQRSVLIGFEAAQNLGTPPTNSSNDVVAIGYRAAQNAKSDSIIAIGSNAARALISEYDSVIAIGTDAFASLTAATASPADVVGMIAIGHGAAGLLTGAGAYGSLLVIGHRAFASAVSSNPIPPPATNFGFNTIVGNSAGELATIANGSAFVANVFLGHGAGYRAPANSLGNIAIGFFALACGAGATGAARNIAIGANALSANLSGSENIAIGAQSYQGGAGTLGALTSGIRNTCVGTFAFTGSPTTGSFNTALGYGINATAAGFDNTFLGASSGNNVGAATSHGNIMIGFSATTQAVSSMNYNVVIGRNAGNYASLVGDYQLVLEVMARGSGPSAANPMNPLIYGRFDLGSIILGRAVDANGLPVNRDLNAAGTGRNLVKILDGIAPDADPVGGGFLYSVAGALFWRGSAGTVTPIAPA